MALGSKPHVWSVKTSPKNKSKASQSLTFLSEILKELLTKFSNFCSVLGSGLPWCQKTVNHGVGRAAETQLRAAIGEDENGGLYLFGRRRQLALYLGQRRRFRRAGLRFVSSWNRCLEKIYCPDKTGWLGCQMEIYRAGESKDYIFEQYFFLNTIWPAYGV